MKGPGLIESLGWTASYLIAQILALAAFVAVFVFVVFGSWPANTQEIVDLCLEIDLDRSFVPLGVTNLLCLFVLAPLVRLRLGRGAREYLMVRRPEATPLILVVGSILPLAIVSEQLYRWSMELWKVLSERFPAVGPFANGNAVELMVQFARAESFPILIVAVALGPAIGEELIFRGLIGNGLVSRWGRATGMVITSLLFAAAHGFPPHALATIPIGLYLHHVYLATGSYWMAVIVHFLNNLLVITLARYGAVEALPASPALLCCSAGYVLMTALLLGREGHPAPVTVAGPMLLTGSAGAATLHLRTRLIAVAAVLTFTSAFVWTAMAGV
ncbi:CAAX amino terminal protease self- immunity [Caulifigura coniformis]|uniref:CAAX amino terminal protease self-immunity n=1 Tax=Caulifigura coniformis TaxID=2527983 RepID=A0A517SHT3_9PLAN|nr:CPBP family intramembrane glutamic endopeptidase [Caulifigura coniformis]QDT55683.1 CAAX amino terminal protease self- immunity [Caulifigura coniformis]